MRVMNGLGVRMLLGFLGAMMVACGPPPAVHNPVPESKLLMDIELIVKQGEDVHSMSPVELFKLASQQLKAQEYAQCARNFDLLWQNLEGTEYFVPSLYNAGLCRERLELWSDAAERYLHLIKVDDGTRDGLDARFRLAECDANLSNWSRVEENMTATLAREDTRHMDRTEGRYRLGMAQVALRKLTEADEAFKTAIKENRVAGTSKLPDKNYFVAGAAYGRALVYHLMFSDVKFRLPEEKMQEDMTTKKELAQQAYSYYIATIRHKNQYWSILSGYMVGKIFEDFYYDILASEIPRDLTDDEVKSYFYALREDLRPLLERALESYEKTSAVSTQIGLDNPWVRRTEERMNRLRTYLNDPTLFDAEETAIIEWNQKLAELDALRSTDPEHVELLVPLPALDLPVAKPAVPE